MMQFSQSGHGDSRLTKLHAHAYYWIQHPCWDHRDQTRAVVHVDNTSWPASFAIPIANLTPIKRVPTVVNFQFLTDMGRMSGELLLAEATGSTSAVKRQDRVWPQSSP
jgi:hypothetical protein